MITFTDAAKAKVAEFLKASGKEGLSLRILIQSRTAKGFTYQFGLEDWKEERPDDLTIREGGFATRLDSDTAKFIRGSVVDWAIKDGAAGFVVQNPNSPLPTGTPEELKMEIIEAIKTIFDPEIPRVNIYDLGLIYDVTVAEDRKATIQMTLTAPNCPAAEQLPAEVQMKSKAVPGIVDAKVDLVFDPPWHTDMMSEAAKLELNL